MNTNNQFTVDLGNLSLTDAQRRSINAAIHSAVAKELGNIELPNNVALVPFVQYLKGPIINGILVWERAELGPEVQKTVQGRVFNEGPLSAELNEQ
ncbi:MAG TPA: hypothetical protein VIM89_18675 [Mucilaginibacter sp.]